MKFPIKDVQVIQAEALERIADNLEILNANLDSLTQDIGQIKETISKNG